eukprot:4396982-Prymnesium_polylepis.1
MLGPCLRASDARSSHISRTLQLQQLGVEDGKANGALCACFGALAALRAVCGAVAAAGRSAALPLRASVVAGLWAVLPPAS